MAPQELPATIARPVAETAAGEAKEGDGAYLLPATLANRHMPGAAERVSKFCLSVGDNLVDYRDCANLKSIYLDTYIRLTTGCRRRLPDQDAGISLSCLTFLPIVNTLISVFQDG